MRKKLIAVVLSAVMVFSLAGCGAAGGIPTYDDVESFVTPTETNPDKSLRKESKVVQTKKQSKPFSVTALSFASVSIFPG